MFYETQCYPLNFWALRLFRLGSSSLVIAGGLLMVSTLNFGFSDVVAGGIFAAIALLTVIGPVLLEYVFPVDANSNRKALLAALQDAQAQAAESGVQRANVGVATPGGGVSSGDGTSVGTTAKGGGATASRIPRDGGDDSGSQSGGTFAPSLATEHSRDDGQPSRSHWHFGSGGDSRLEYLPPVRRSVRD